jgi:broad specificity phosphatase PhoE
VLGSETADAAYGRFGAAVDAVVRDAAAAATRDVAIVSHGTVISLFAQRRSGQDPFALWRKMGLPSFAVFDLTTAKLLEVRDRV